MIIKEAKYEEKMVKRSIRIENAIYGCDECGCELNNNEINTLELTVFHNNTDKEPNTLVFCSWDCVIKKLQSIECDHFITLPYLTMDIDGRNGGRYLIELLSKINNKL